MDKKLTTTLGIALGASLLAGAGYGIYKFFSNRFGKVAGGDLAGSNTLLNTGFMGGYLGNSLVKSHNLYGLGYVKNGLVGGGLYKTQNGIVTGV